MKKSYVFLICLLIFSSFSFSQAINIKLSSDKTILEAGIPIQIKFEANTQGQLTIKFPLSFLKGATSKSTSQNFNPKEGISTVSYSFIQQGTFKDPGKYKIFAIYVANGKKYKSNKITIKVVKVKKDIQKKDIKIKTIDA